MIFEIVHAAAGNAQPIEETALILHGGIRNDPTVYRIKTSNAYAILSEGWQDVFGVRSRKSGETNGSAKQANHMMASFPIHQEKPLAQGVSAVNDNADAHCLKLRLPVVGIANVTNLPLYADDIRLGIRRCIRRISNAFLQNLIEVSGVWKCWERNV